MSTSLVTGAAGFIGYHIAAQLLNRGDTVVGIDNLNNYYDVNLKQARLKQLQTHENFIFYPIDIANREAVLNLKNQHPDIQSCTHLAAQAGVRYSISNPFAYTDSNMIGHLTILELCRALPDLQHIVYASSSSVYGANQKLPFSVHDPVDHPVSLYAATKRSCELMSYTYSHLYGIPATGLRFFTVYGPWGRPDMSTFIFTQKILAGEEIPVFNQGEMRRNFTYIDDIVQGTLSCLDKPPISANLQTNNSAMSTNTHSSSNTNSNAVPHRVYNIGNNRSEHLMDFIQTLENILQKKAKIRFEPMQAGDVKETVADITDTINDFGFDPKTNIQEGLHHFVNWYKSYYV